MTTDKTSYTDEAAAIKQTASEIAQWDADVATLPVSVPASVAQLQRELRDRYTFEHPLPIDAVVSDVSSLLRGQTTHACHPRHFGLYQPGVCTASVLGDTLTALYNPQVGAWWYAPAACEIEQLVLRFFLTKIGFDEETAAAHFTTGGSEATATAVLTALARRFPEVGRRGLRGLSPTIYASEQAHDSVMKIAQMTGIGRDSVRRVPADASERLDVDALAAQVEGDALAGHAPLLVIATAGTTGSGAIDPLEDLASFCRDRRLWLHVDAAWGGIALLSRSSAPLLAGISEADSVTWDAHKCLPVPTGAGMFFCRHAGHVRSAFDVHTAYVPDEVAGSQDMYRSTMQWSRRFIGLKVFMVIAERGGRGIEAMVDHQLDMGRALKQKLVSAGWSVLNDTPLPVVCVTHRDFSRRRSSIQRAVKSIIDRGRVWLSEIRLGETESAFRACICNHRTDASDLDVLVAELEQERARLR